jgi:putrescine transport system ATP-binding protein
LPGAEAPQLRLEDLTKHFGTHRAVEAVSLVLEPGEFFCLLGPSGCGKSTLLRMIAGFETPTGGRILLGARDLTALPPHRRPVNMMFQSYALFPHMSVAGNIGYGLKGLGRAVAADRVSELLRLVRLEGFGDRRPDTLSGGQRQRVALARALARQPELLLLDEPLGALDRGLREETQGELRAVQRRLGTAFVVVTHDPEEAMMLADRIGVMEGGRLIQVGPPAELYRRPASRFVANLLGDVNLIPGRLGPERPEGIRTVETPHGPVEAVAPVALGEGAAVVVAVRPEDLILGMDGLPVVIADAVFLGDRLRRTLRLPDGSTLRASGRPADAEAAPGSTARAGFAADAAVILPA